ncbi:hypothetical protein B0H67DRAFT_560930 [Lasiosphaeris hirsuta]|uniref:Methyltransferase n=1 Tax=Lasiosphaeris hirsuta TaxID=260670 RepID=A0AA40E7T6_9PEZI|nr:hypothetical protein B0H67DRAFT_560930 [Lasiosphaeris hirsuta]
MEPQNLATPYLSQPPSQSRKKLGVQPSHSPPTMAQTMTLTMTEPPESRVHVDLPYLARSPLFQTEKPYATVFDVSGNPAATATNHVIELNEHDVVNARHLPEGTFSLEANGFEFLRRPNCLDASTAYDQDLVNTRFRQEMKDVLRSRFPQYTSIIYLDHTVRKRSPMFPSKPGTPVTSPQPAALPHFDFTTRGSFIRMSQLYPGEPEVYQDREFDLINIWKVLAGPNNDWPLAVCDYQSVDFANDHVANDVINERTVGENGLMHYNSRHRWYYLADQEVDDLIVFRNSNSLGRRSIAFHAAFDPKKVDGPPRQSIEIRFAGFY